MNPKLDEFSQILEQIIYNYNNFASDKSHNDGGLVVAVEGQYGTGKTTFLHLFSNKIEKPSEYCVGSNGRETNNIYSYVTDPGTPSNKF